MLYAIIMFQKCLRICVCADFLFSLSASPEQDVLLLSCTDSSIRLVERNTGECLHAFWGHRYSPNNGFRIQNTFYTSTRRLPAADLFDSVTSEVRDDATASHGLLLDSCVQESVPSSIDDILEEANRAKGAVHSFKKELENLRPYAVSGSEDCCVYFWDICVAAENSSVDAICRSSGIAQAHAKAHDSTVLCVKTHSATQRLCTASADGCVKLWRLVS